MYTLVHTVVQCETEHGAEQERHGQVKEEQEHSGDRKRQREKQRIRCDKWKRVGKSSIWALSVCSLVLVLVSRSAIWFSMVLMRTLHFGTVFFFTAIEKNMLACTKQSWVYWLYSHRTETTIFGIAWHEKNEKKKKTKTRKLSTHCEG